MENNKQSPNIKTVIKIMNKNIALQFTKILQNVFKIYPRQQNM